MVELFRIQWLFLACVLVGFLLFVLLFLIKYILVSNVGRCTFLILPLFCERKIFVLKLTVIAHERLIEKCNPC